MDKEELDAHTLVIGLGHKARQGKDSVARFLFEAYPKQVIRIGFADALKSYCRVEHGMTEKDGVLLQKVGLAMRMTRGEEVWINAVYWALRDLQPRVAIITDMRFRNEAAFVRSLNGVTVNVKRTDLDGSPYRVDDGRDLQHPSEIDLDGYPYDYTIENTGTLDQLKLRTLTKFSLILQELRATPLERFAA